MKLKKLTDNVYYLPAVDELVWPVLTYVRGERFALLPEYGCRNTLLNGRALCLREDFARLGVQTARLLFTTEAPEECARIARAFLEDTPLAR